MVTRRSFIKSSGLYLLGYSLLPLTLRRAMAGVTSQVNGGKSKKALVVIFQRGAADGLSMVPPLGDRYYGKEIRPSLALSSSGDDAAINLDGFFGLHPALKPLLPFWNAGRLAIVHEVGSPNNTRSHFDAQDYMESGTPGVKITEDGFLDRAIEVFPSDALPTTFRAVALQPNLPRSLWGKGGAFAMNSIREFSANSALGHSGVGNGFESLYDSAMDQVLKGAGQKTFDALKTLNALPVAQNNDKYPKSPLGKRLADIAQLIRSPLGLRIAVTDCGGWDTHQRQGAALGQLAGHLQDLGKSIAAFVEDLGPKIEDVCVVTMTEFGRTVKENGNGGTDRTVGLGRAIDLNV